MTTSLMYANTISSHLEDWAFIVIARRELLKVLSSKPHDPLYTFVSHLTMS